MAKYIRGTGRSEKAKTKEYYKKERQKQKERKGRQAVRAELDKPEVIYMLADNPVYIHSNKLYHEYGLKAAHEILKRDLDKAAAGVKKLLPGKIALLQARTNEIMRILKCSNWQELQSWWSSVVGGSGENMSDNPEAVRMLRLLEKVKQQATDIGIYKRGRKTSSGVKTLQELGLVSTTFTGGSGERVGKEDLISIIRAEQRKDLAELARGISALLKQLDIDYAESIQKEIKSLVGEDLEPLQVINPEATHAKEIGKLFDIFSDSVVYSTLNGISVKLDMVAAEKQKFSKSQTRLGELDNSARFKGDTLITIAELGIDFVASNKTGLTRNFGRVSNSDLKYLSLFTAGLSTDTLKLDTIQSTSYIDFKQIDPELDNIFQYIVRNSDFYSERGETYKELIVALFAWAHLITELIGFDQDIDHIPIVIRVFDKLYPTHEVLRMFTNIQGLDIMDYVNKTYLERFYQGYTSETKSIDQRKLRNIKKKAMQDMHGKVTYEKLKYAINDTLVELGGQMARPKERYFKTSYRIILDNLDNLQ